MFEYLIYFKDGKMAICSAARAEFTETSIELYDEENHLIAFFSRDTVEKFLQNAPNLLWQA